MLTACFEHIHVYFVPIICIFLCSSLCNGIFCAYFGMQLHIKGIFQFCRSPGRSCSGLFRFRFGSALATALYQHSLPVNTLICQSPPTVAPALVGWRWGWQLLACRPLACRPPGHPTALIGEPNTPGRRPPGTPSSCQLLLCSFHLVLICDCCEPRSSPPQTYKLSHVLHGLA